MGKKDFGGIIRMRLSTGEQISLRGTLNMNTAGMTAEAITNQDGETDRVLTPKASSAAFTAADRGYDLRQLIAGPRRNVTFFEDTTNVTHYFTDAFFTGDPEKNRINGELGGLMIHGKYKKIEG